MHDYASFFSIVSYDGVDYIELQDKVTMEDLRHQFRKNLTVDLAKAFSGKESLQALKISATA